MAKLKMNNYDVVILDILMPVMDGEETINAIRAGNQALSQQYCIALTASSFQDQRDRLLNLGFDAFLSKPLTLDQLSAALNEVPRALQAMPNVEGHFIESTDVIEEAESPAFDFSYLKSQFGDAHKDVFKDIAPSFLDHAYRELAELKELAGTQNIERIKHLSHSMKGAASSVGLTDLAKALLHIENNAEPGNISQHIAEVEQIMTELKPLIQQELDAIDANS